MPHALTKRQKEYLEYIKDYITKNESSPRLEEIADHFEVTPPSVHKMLEKLQRKGFIHFGRDRLSGFFIRLYERAGSAELVMEVPIHGKLNRYGEIVETKYDGHFTSVFVGGDPDTIFALAVIENIPEENIVAGDLIIFDYDREPVQGDMCIVPFGERFFLLKVPSKTLDKRSQALVMAQHFPVPNSLKNEDFEQHFHWHPAAFSDETADYFEETLTKMGVPEKAIPPNIIFATAIRLSRPLTF